MCAHTAARLCWQAWRTQGKTHRPKPEISPSPPNGSKALGAAAGDAPTQTIPEGDDGGNWMGVSGATSTGTPGTPFLDITSGGS